MTLAAKSKPGVIFTSPVRQPPSALHARTNSGPAALKIAAHGDGVNLGLNEREARP